MSTSANSPSTTASQSPVDDPLPVDFHPLIAYFRSGWAFLIPYLATYLLYAWLKWPVNPAVASQQSATGNPASWVLCMLHVYWFLHGLHLVLGGLALRIWWRNPQRSVLNAWHRLYAILPWLCLALLILIPGVYLEMPSDPWSHFSRVNQWQTIATPIDNPDWKKSGSFLAYSFVGQADAPFLQLAAFNIFYTACCLLYCWQYFRMTRTLGLSRSHAFIALLVNFLVFGNNIFGFMRYYGMSTTILAHTGIFALTRILFSNLRHGCSGQNAAISQSNLSPALGSRWPVAACCFGTLGVLIGMNHLQGLAIAGIIAASMLCWHMTHSTLRKTVVFLIGILLINILVVFFWPRHPNIDALYRPSGWLTSWYGFNILNPSSPAFERSIQILGVFGVVNFFAGLVLVWRGHVIGWLTAAPVMVLLLPLFAIPFSDAVSRFGPPGYEYIVAFHRVLLGIPAGLAFCALLPLKERAINSCQFRYSSRKSAYSIPTLLGASLLGLLLLPTSAPYYNRLWHQIMIPPQDLEEKHIVAIAKHPAFSLETEYSNRFTATGHILSTPGLGMAISSFGNTAILYRNKWMTYPTPTTPAVRFDLMLNSMKDSVHRHEYAVIVVPSYKNLISSYSCAGFLSGHWPMQQVALEQMSSEELKKEIFPYFELADTVDSIGIYKSRPPSNDFSR